MKNLNAQRWISISLVVTQMLVNLPNDVTCTLTTQMTTTHTTTAEPLLSPTAVKKWEAIFYSSSHHSDSSEEEGENMFQYLDTYEVEPPITEPNEEWLLQRHPSDGGTDISSTSDLSFLEMDDSRTSSSEASHLNRKIRSRGKVKKSYSTSQTSRKRFRRISRLNNVSSVRVRNRVQLIHELVDNFYKSGKSFSFGLSLFLKRIAPKLFNEIDSLSAIPQEKVRRKNIAFQTVLQTLMRYRALKKLYLEHANRLKVVFKPDLFQQRLTSRYSPAALDDSSGDNGLVKRLVQNVDRAGSALEHLDKEIEVVAAVYFPASNEFRNGKNKAFVRISAIRELGLKAPSSMQVVQAIRDTSQRSSFLEKVKVVSGLIEHRILNDMVIENLKILMKAMDTLGKEESDERDEMDDVRLVESARGSRSVQSNFEDDDRNSNENTAHQAINEFNVSKFSALVVKKFKDFVIKQVSKELTLELKSIFTVPFMIPYAENLTSDTKLAEMIIKKVKDLIKLLKLSKLFATFRASSELDAEMRHATRVAEETLIKATVPILLTTGNTLIKRFAITGANRPRQGIRSPIRKSNNMIQKNQRSNQKNEKKSKTQRICADSDFDDDISAEKTAMNFIVKNIMDEDLKIDEDFSDILLTPTLLTPGTTSNVLAGSIIDENSNEVRK